MARHWKPEYVIFVVMGVLYMLGFWTLGTTMQRLDVRLYRMEVASKVLAARFGVRWTRGDQTHWAQEFTRLNPGIKVPPVPPVSNPTALPQAPPLPGVKMEGVAKP